MHVTALIGGFGEDLADRRPEARMVVGDDELDAGQPALAQAEEEVAPARPALAVGQLDARTWRRQSQSMPMAIITAWLAITPASRTFS